jgi:tRNA A-37 threonylcarbamoyl transferase component Bud32
MTTLSGDATASFMLNDIFVINERLGIGATAEVFAARRRDTNDPRALKIFTPLVLSDPDTVKRIEGEVSALRALQHTNIVHLFAAHSAPNELALELEYVCGSDLRAWRKEYSLNLHEPLLWILCQIARGIGCAHENGILHRDLKPENVLVSERGEVKLTDFGLARQLDAITITKSGLLAGSLGYMAPEMLDGERCSTLSDVFSFGAVAYELLAGVNPFAGPNPQSMLKRMFSGEIRPLGELVPGLPDAITALVQSCLALDPQKRPASIWHVQGDLMSALAGGAGHGKHYRALISRLNRTPAIEAAFLEKRRELEARREALLPGNRATAIALAREWSYALPDSPAPAEILAALSEPRRPAVWQKVLAATLLLLFLGSGGWLLLLTRSTEPAAVLAPPISTVPIPTAQDKIILPAAAPSTPRLGWIRVAADNDVRLYLDGAEIPRAQWNHIPADPGQRRLKLVKEGFLPIENVIPVRAGKTAVVNAKGGA